MTAVGNQSMALIIQPKYRRAAVGIPRADRTGTAPRSPDRHSPSIRRVCDRQCGRPGDVDCTAFILTTKGCTALWPGTAATRSSPLREVDFPRAMLVQCGLDPHGHCHAMRIRASSALSQHAFSGQFMVLRRIEGLVSRKWHLVGRPLRRFFPSPGLGERLASTEIITAGRSRRGQGGQLQYGTAHFCMFASVG